MGGGLIGDDDEGVEEDDEGALPPLLLPPSPPSLTLTGLPTTASQRANRPIESIFQDLTPGKAAKNGNALLSLIMEFLSIDKEFRFQRTKQIHTNQYACY